MRGLSSFVIDQYDDSKGEVLASRFPDMKQIPEFVKTAQRLSNEQKDALPDDHFALVLFDEGMKMKKFAMVDKGNTALSVVYLLENSHFLPPEAVKLAASNLINACEHFELSVPLKLKEAAATGLSGVSGKSRTQYGRGAKINRIQFDSPKTEEGQFTDNPELGKDEEDQDLKQRANFTTPQGTNFERIPLMTEKEKYEPDGLNMEKNAGAFGDAPGTVVQREKTWREPNAYLDISGWKPDQAFSEPQQAADQTLLRGHYPVDSFDQTKTASAYFIENWKKFDPRDRHEYCVKLAARLEELGLDVSDEIARYGSSTYASDVEDFVLARKSLIAEEFHPSLDMLLEKRASITPGTFAEALNDIDHMSDLRYHWDSHIPDPWYTTFGPSLEKIAAASWVFDEMGVRTDEAELKALAMNGHHLVSKSFGEKFADEFAKGPKTFFEALPKPQKLVLARLSSDRHAGTATE